MGGLSTAYTMMESNVERARKIEEAKRNGQVSRQTAHHAPHTKAHTTRLPPVVSCPDTLLSQPSISSADSRRVLLPTCTNSKMTRKIASRQSLTSPCTSRLIVRVVTVTQCSSLHQVLAAYSTILLTESPWSCPNKCYLVIPISSDIILCHQRVHYRWQHLSCRCGICIQPNHVQLQHCSLLRASTQSRVVRTSSAARGGVQGTITTPRISPPMHTCCRLISAAQSMRYRWGSKKYRRRITRFWMANVIVSRRSYSSCGIIPCLPRYCTARFRCAPCCGSTISPTTSSSTACTLSSVLSSSQGVRVRDVA